jgi:CheY-like chemotaxis protein
MARNTILVVDDDPADTALIKHVFGASKIRNPIQAVGDGEQAIAYLKGEGVYAQRESYPYPILLLLDLKMPIKSGFDVLEWLQRQPNPTGMAVVVLTGATDTRDLNRAYQLGAHSFLTKPLEREELMNLINGIRGLRVEPGAEGIQLSPA